MGLWTAGPSKAKLSAQEWISGGIMDIRKIALTILAALSAAACAHQAPVAVAPNLNVYSSYGEKLPGSYLLFVDGGALDTVVKPTGMNCSFHSYPVQLAQPFRQSVVKTVEQLVENVQVVDRPLTLADLQNQGKAGMIIVKAENINARLQVIEGFWSSSADSTVELTASLTVDAVPGGRLLGTSASGDGNGRSPAGAFCGESGKSIGVASEAAMKELLGQLGERMSNSPRLRDVRQAQR